MAGPSKYPLTEAQINGIMTIIAANPLSNRSEIIELFFQKSGLRVSPATVWRYREKVKASGSLVGSVFLESHSGPCVCLSEDQRKIIVGLIEKNPSATNGQIRNIFVKKTGREIHRSLVQHYRKPRDSNRLTSAERDGLVQIAMAISGPVRWVDVAKQFEREYGQTISDQTVANTLEKLGYKSPGRGKNSRMKVPLGSGDSP